MKISSNPASSNLSLRSIITIACSFLAFCCAQAQPTIVSTVPANNATGVSPSAAVVFTFSEAMDTSATDAQFIDGTTAATLPTSPVWSSGNTILTCTPTPAFPSGKPIAWVVSGQNPTGDSLGGNDNGFFFTGSGGGGTGSGTNKFTTFSVGKQHLFDQTTTGAPVLDPTLSYGFSGQTTLASNRTATNISLTLPTSVVTNLTQNFVRPEIYYVFTDSTNLSAFDASYPIGSYIFNVSATASNQQVTVNLPNLAQPNAPHVSNFAAAQSINPAQPFVLSWDAFSGGTAADFIFVSIGNVYMTTNPGLTGALNGTATSVTIPANTLQANSNYDASIGFYHASIVSNATYTTIASVGTVTLFSMVTSSGGSTAQITLTNGVRAANTFSFDVVAPASQTITVESSSTLQAGSWTSLTTTNMPAGGRAHVSDPHSTTNRYIFYRARTGS